MALSTAKLRQALAESADLIDLSPRQWYLLSAQINLGHIFKEAGDYDLYWRPEEDQERLRTNAQRRLVRNSGSFVRTTNNLQKKLATDAAAARDNTILPLPDDAPISLRKAQVAVSWLRVSADGVTDGWRLVAPRIGLILPEEDLGGDQDSAKATPEHDDLVPAGSLTSREAGILEASPVPLGESLAKLSLTEDLWELLAARFGPAGDADTREIAESFSLDREQVILLLATIQDQLVESVDALSPALATLERHIASRWPINDRVTVRESGLLMMNALELGEILAEREETDRLVNVLRCIDKSGSHFLDKFPRVRERIWTVQLPRKPAL